MPQYLDYTDNFTRPIIDPPGAREGAADTSTIKTATGKILHVDVVSRPRNADYAYFFITGEKLSTIAAIFEDPAETALIEYGGEKISGYTRVGDINPTDGAIRVRMEKEA